MVLGKFLILLSLELRGELCTVCLQAGRAEQEKWRIAGTIQMWNPGNQTETPEVAVRINSAMMYTKKKPKEHHIFFIWMY